MNEAMIAMMLAWTFNFIAIYFAGKGKWFLSTFSVVYVWGFVAASLCWADWWPK